MFKKFKKIDISTSCGTKKVIALALHHIHLHKGGIEFQNSYFEIKEVFISQNYVYAKWVKFNFNLIKISSLT